MSFFFLPKKGGGRKEKKNKTYFLCALARDTHAIRSMISRRDLRERGGVILGRVSSLRAEEAHRVSRASIRVCRACTERENALATTTTTDVRRVRRVRRVCPRLYGISRQTIVNRTSDVMRDSPLAKEECTGRAGGAPERRFRVHARRVLARVRRCVRCDEREHKITLVGSTIDLRRGPRNRLSISHVRESMDR